MAVESAAGSGITVTGSDTGDATATSGRPNLLTPDGVHGPAEDGAAAIAGTGAAAAVTGAPVSAVKHCPHQLLSAGEDAPHDGQLRTNPYRPATCRG